MEILTLKLTCLIMEQKQIPKHWASLKAEVYQLDINELVPVPVDLSKVSDVVKDDVVKKTLYARLIAKVNSIILENLF